MHIPEARIQLRADCAKGNAEFGRFTKRAGEWVWVCPVYYPGEPHNEGSIGWHTSPDHKRTEWSFWTSYDIDGAFIFSAEDVAMLEVPAEHGELPEAFATAPFAVVRA